MKEKEFKDPERFLNPFCVLPVIIYEIRFMKNGELQMISRGAAEDCLKMKDSELTARIRKGETKYLDVLAEKYYDEIFRFCYCKTGNREAAYDCTQETFLHLLRYLEAYTEQKKFRAWLYRIASNVCIDYFRSMARSPAGEESLELLQEEDSHFEKIEKNELVQRALGCLSEQQRETIVLYFYHGFKLREIAEIMDVKMSTVKSRFRQGMEKMKCCLRREELNR